VYYGETFTLQVDGTIARVALMRCGSVTHGYDSDQRYIGLAFSQQGDQLTVTAPPDGATAPPGYYMLWVVDAAGVPCERAQFLHLPKFIRLTKPQRVFLRHKRPVRPHIGPKKKSRPPVRRTPHR
jgi:hypothetical protein